MLAHDCQLESVRHWSDEVALRGDKLSIHISCDLSEGTLFVAGGG